MVKKAGFIASNSYDHVHVERTLLLNEIDEELARGGIVTLCGPWGYGKSDLLDTYARIVHAKTPMRPIVRVDFESYEAQAFLRGNPAPLDGRLAREARSALWLVDSCGAGDGDAGEPEPPARRCAAREATGCDASPEVLLLSTAARALAPGWVARFKRRARCAEPSFGEMPLVVLDNLPAFEERQAAEFVGLLRRWVQYGARVLMACGPSALLGSFLLPEAHVVPAPRLAVSAEEMAKWVCELNLADGRELGELCGGVPFLVDACRAVVEGSPWTDGAFMGAVGRVVGHALDEPMCEGAQDARRAVIMLGEGRLEDLATVGASLREDELGILADSFPLFGLDRSTGGFRCVPVPTGRGSKVAERVVSENEALAERCARFLIVRKNYARAGDIASMLSEGVRLCLYGTFPDVFADAAHDEAIGRSLRSISADGGARPVLEVGLGRLARLYATAHDLPVKIFSFDAGRGGLGPASGASEALQTVLGYWRGFSGLGAKSARPLYLMDPSGPFDEGGHGDDYEEAFERLASPAGREGLYDVDTVVHAMGSAAMRGNAEGFREQLRRLEGLVAFSDCGLGEALYACHVTLCGFLCGEFEMTFGWLDPLAATLSARRERSRVKTVSDALVSSLHAAARMLVEKPSVPGVSEHAQTTLRVAREFFSERDILPGKAFVSMLEALCALLDGRERGADASLRACQARWGVQGALAGQLAVALGLSLSCFARDAVNQALIYAQTAEALAQKMGLQRAVWFARLFVSVATVRAGTVPDIDRRLLEATLRQTSLYPRVSCALNVELAVLYSAVDDSPAARDALKGIAIAAKPAYYRFLVATVRALGKERSAVLGVLPRGIRREYEYLRPLRPVGASERPSGLGVGRAFAVDTGRGERPLRVSLFGGLRVTANGHRIANTQWGRRKARTVMILLALFPDGALTREAVMRGLWPGQHDALARNALSTVLTSLRTTLGQKRGGPQYIVSSGDVISFDAGLVDVDVRHFEHTARVVMASPLGTDPSAVLDACATLEGLFRSGFAEELSSLPREALRRMEELSSLFVDCMVKGVGLAVEAADSQLALWFARAAADVDGGREDVRRARDLAMALSKKPPKPAQCKALPEPAPEARHV